MLSNAVLLAASNAAQAAFIAGGSSCMCFHYHVSPTWKPVPATTPFMTFTELDEYDEMVASGGAVPLRGNSTNAPDVILAKYRLRGAMTDSAGDNATALALTTQMRADKQLFRSMLKVGVNLRLSGAVLEFGKKLHISSPRYGPYDTGKPVRLELSWECTITVKESLS